MMIEKQKSGFVIAALTLVIFLSMTLWFWRTAGQQSLAFASQRFDFRNGDIALSVAQRLDNYEQVLIAAAAFMERAGDVDRTDWRHYVERLRAEERFPGIQGLGYAKWLAPDERRELVRSVREEGYRDFRVWPSGDRRRYSTILFLEPETWRNERALGYDMYSEPTRRQAMARARDSGQVSASRTVQLVQEDGTNEQAGFLLYFPVYSADIPPQTVRERRNTLEGWVYSPFRIHDLMRGIMGTIALPYRRLQIYEGSSTDPGQRIFDSESRNPEADAHEPIFVAQREIDFNGVHWTLRFTSLPSFEQSADINQPTWLLVSGILFSVLMSAFVWALWVNQRRGWALSRASLRLREEASQRETLKEELRQFFSISPDILCTLNSDGSFRHTNAAGESILGYPSSVLQQQSFLETVHPDDKDAVVEYVEELKSRRAKRITREIRNVSATGEIRWVEWSFVAAERDGIYYGYGRDITSRKHMEQQLHHTAFHDKLTGVANRALFLDRLAHVIDRAQRFGESYAVFIMDIDNFKSVNDSYGHLVGDKLLVAFAERVQRQLRPVDTCARFGGDEFTLLVEETDSENSIRQLADRILTSLSPAFLIDGHEFYVGSSIGIAMGGTPEHSYDTAEEVIKHADLALYEAKSQGKGRFVMFDKQMQSTQVNRSQMESDLRQAVDRNEMQVFYQPIVELNHGEIAGCEALVRWEHPMLGRVQPDKFIGVAEASGLITHIGRYVTDSACRALAQWRREAVVTPDFFVSVNLSPREFFLHDSVDYIKHTLAKYRLQGHNLRIEVTEGVLIERDDEAGAIFSELQDLGVQIYIDDFGTGYSSLSYLRSLPVNGIKLDRSFMDKIRSTRKNQEIARTVLELAKVLELQSIVEGVETDDQLEFVKSLGFGFAQGFGLHFPMPALEINVLMHSHNSHRHSPRLHS